MNNDLNNSTQELKRSIDRLHKRFNSWWKIIWFGMLQGAGAVIGATLLILLVSFTLNILGVFPFLGDTAESLRLLLKDARGN